MWRNMETEPDDLNQRLPPLSHWCVRHVMENGEEIKFMVTNAPRTSTRIDEQGEK